jgi:hypothetical protein
MAFLEGAVVAAAFIYAIIWTCAALILFLFRRRKVRAKERAMLEVFDDHIPL